MIDTSTEDPQREDRQRVLIALANELIKSRDEAVQYRANSGIERQWSEDEAAFSEGTQSGSVGNSVTDYAQGIGAKQLEDGNVRSGVVVNIIRGRTEVAEARFSDIQLPTDDRNWGCRVTPDPDLSDQTQDKRPALQNGMQVTDKSGAPATMADVANDKKAVARKAMGKMEMVIDDQLSECDYNAEQRKLIQQAVRLGTGIIKGPNVVKNLKKSWKQQKQEDGSVVYIIDIKEDQQPASRWVDIWNVYPSPSTTSNIQKSCEYIWEKDTILPRDVKKLIGVDGYFDDQLIAVLNEEPKRSSIQTGRMGEKVSKVEQGKSYELWEGYIDLDREYLQIIGCDCNNGVETKLMSCCVVMINDRPVKVELNVLDTGDIPYDFWQWSTVNINSPWGIGVPRMLIWLQRIMIAAWRAMMDNSGDSARTTIVMSKDLEPQNGIWQLGEIFIAMGDLEDARKAFATFEVRNNQPHYQAIIDLVLRFADIETTLPMIFQGESQKIPDTLGQTNVVVDSANVGTRHRTKSYDDNITDKHITRYYHYNMQYNKDNSIKGDFDVISRGTSVLLERDQQGRAVLEVYNLKADPTFARAVNWDRAAELAVKSKRLDILKTEDELKRYDEQQAQQQPQAANPALEVAKVRTDGDMQKEQLRQQSDMAELEFKAKQAELDRQHALQIKQMDFQMKQMEYAEKKGINLDQLKVQLALSAGSKQSPQVAIPPTEPAGRAPNGEAYQA